MAYDMGLYQPERVTAEGMATLCNLWSKNGGFRGVDFLPGESRPAPSQDQVKAKLDAFSKGHQWPTERT